MRSFTPIKAVGLMLAVGFMWLVTPVRGIDQAMPPAPRGAAAEGSRLDPHAGLAGRAPMDALAAGGGLAEDRSAFAGEVKLDAFRRLAIQHQDQVKILDSWARQSLRAIANRQSVEGAAINDPLYIALDIAFRPEAWVDRDIIYIQAVPIREQLMRFANGPAEAQRLLHEGRVSPRFLDRPGVSELLDQIGLNTKQTQAVNKVRIAQGTFNHLWETLLLVPPVAALRAGEAEPWRMPVEFLGNLPDSAQRAQALGFKDLPAVPGYTEDQARRIVLAFNELVSGWHSGDASEVNVGIDAFAGVLPRIDPGGYPSSAKRTMEIWYNRSFNGTVANVFLYFIAMTLFLLVAVGVSVRLRPYAYTLFTIAVVVHLSSMGVRMWLAGRWPTQNQFESVLGAALLGCILGWLLETWRKNGLFGMAFSFVGFLAMTACMAAPYMFGTDLGGAISKTAGILQTYWLYIHVNIVIASYALIAATFVLGAVYLKIRLWHWVNPLEPGAQSGPAFPLVMPSSAAFEPATRAQQAALLPNAQIAAQRAATLAMLDQANMVILQMAFWFLGIGILCGAVWADHSWGRPWGWDPKETFALITWMVYLIIVHVRIVMPKLKADATAWLSIAGFLIMMFNWIGVNFFLAGLHSYA